MCKDSQQKSAAASKAQAAQDRGNASSPRSEKANESSTSGSDEKEESGCDKKEEIETEGVQRTKKGSTPRKGSDAPKDSTGIVLDPLSFLLDSTL